MLKLPPPVWALTYALVAFGATRLTGAAPIAGLPIVPLGVVLIAAGVGLAVSAAWLFRRAETEINPTSPTNRALVTTGPFRFTRNPMYLGLVIATVGIAIGVGAWPMFLAPVATFATANWVHIPFEEAKMRRQFGSDFNAYTSLVRRWI